MIVCMCSQWQRLRGLGFDPAAGVDPVSPGVTRQEHSPGRAQVSALRGAAWLVGSAPCARLEALVGLVVQSTLQSSWLPPSPWTVLGALLVATCSSRVPQAGPSAAQSLSPMPWPVRGAGDTSCGHHAALFWAAGQEGLSSVHGNHFLKYKWRMFSRVTCDIGAATVLFGQLLPFLSTGPNVLSCFFM